MPVSEPPWTAQNSGTAARNGTTSHTINFGFTSTTGNFLVFVVHGAVTHAATGWTERLSPVGSGELSVFTKTSAGESSITVTHNGSDFPVVWSAYEFASATTWVNGASNSQSSDAFPLLGSLPGTEVVVFGGRGRAAGTTAATSASSTVSAPWVEDADIFAADNGTTDGCYLHVIHQINVTATSITPTATPTYGGDWGAVPDRQHVAFALDVPASTVTGTLTATLPTLTGDIDGQGIARSTLTGTLPALAATLTGAAKASGSITGTLPALQAHIVETESAAVGPRVVTTTPGRYTTSTIGGRL